MYAVLSCRLRGVRSPSFAEFFSSGIAFNIKLSWRFRLYSMYINTFICAVLGHWESFCLSSSVQVLPLNMTTNRDCYAWNCRDSPHSKWKFSWRWIRTTDHRINAQWSYHWAILTLKDLSSTMNQISIEFHNKRHLTVSECPISKLRFWKYFTLVVWMLRLCL